MTELFSLYGAQLKSKANALRNILGSRRRHFLGQCTHLLEVPILLDLLSFHRLLFLRQNVLLAHADLKAFLEATALAEATCLLYTSDAADE